MVQRDPHEEAILTKRLLPGRNRDLKSGLRLMEEAGGLECSSEQSAHVMVLVLQRNRVNLGVREGVIRNEILIGLGQ